MTSTQYCVTHKKVCTDEHSRRSRAKLSHDNLSVFLFHVTMLHEGGGDGGREGRGREWVGRREGGDGGERGREGKQYKTVVSYHQNTHISGKHEHTIK